MDAPSVSPDRRQRVDEARARWISRLIDLSPRNNLLYFRELKTGTLDLTASKPDLLAKLLDGSEVPLHKLLPDADRDRLKTQARQIARKARQNFDERGIDTLHIAAGMAAWKSQDPSRRPPESAVIMLPVKIEVRVRSDAVLRRTGEPRLNDVLLHVLAHQFNRTLDPEKIIAAADTEPERDGDSFDLDALLRKVQTLAEGIPDFQVRRRIALGNFFFQKIAMVRDLEFLGDQLAAHDVVAAFAGDTPAQSAMGTAAAQAKVDPRSLDQVPPRNEFLVIDSDSSQHQAIAAALAGTTCVIQGPPGTGKSQVITNLIAAATAAGKRILFVAEKRAALDVVRNRLTHNGLGHLALDLHGADTSRKQIALKLRDALESLSRGELVLSDEPLDRLAQRRSTLNEHADRMHRPRQPSCLSVFELLGKLLRWPVTNVVPLRTRFRSPTLDALTPSAVNEIRDLLTSAAAEADLFLRTDPSPWVNAQLADGAAAQVAIDLVATMNDQSLPEAIKLTHDVLSPLGGTLPPTLPARLEVLQVLRVAIALRERYQPALFTQALASYATALEPADGGWLARLLAKLTNSAYRAALNAVQSVAVPGVAPTPQQLRLDVVQARGLLERWHNLGFTVPLHDTTYLSSLTAGAIDRAIGTIAGCLQQLDHITRIVGAHIGGLSVDELTQALSSLRSDQLTPRKLPSVRKVEHALERQYGLGALLQELRSTRPSADTWSALFEQAWLASCLDRAITEDPDLASFNGIVHEKLAEEFRDLDRSALKLSQARVAQLHHRAAQAVLASHGDQAAIVRREAEKKARHIPFRKLIDQAPDVLTTLFPCFMCSPLSVSQLLPGERKLFDIVVFDEASQILQEDAVCAVARGDHTVMAGDQHQLPPTPFFADMSGELDEEIAEEADDDPMAGFESALARMSSFAPSWMLQWHYRSRDERLIAFSNRHIYASRLVTFPGPGAGVPPLSHIKVEAASNGGEEDSTGEEVSRVVELILAFARKQLASPAEKRNTLGVIALGITHAERLQNALDQALEDHPELDAYFDPGAADPFFIKNIERVQGDERDAIILSLGVTKRQNGRVSLTRFGPLNSRENGYRRLNVAITRAKESLTLVSSFSHHDLDGSDNASRGVQLLREFLQFAANGGHYQQNAAGPTSAPQSIYADVAEALVVKGIHVMTHWGTSTYRVDLVARHPTRPERFVLAIECDGATYRSAATARERDRLRQQHLQALGWRFHRVWSVDWFNNREAELERLVKSYQQAVAVADSADGQGVSEQPA